MPNMLDYLSWRGDLRVEQDAINENDELIFSQLAYVAFGDRIPGLDEPEKSVALGETASWLLAHDPQAEKIHQTGFMWKNNRELLKALAGSPRFADMRLSRYVDSVSAEDEKQFAAVTIDIGDGTTLVAFRGTDDTLVGWKEDLNMVYGDPVPAQLEAVRYVQEVARTTRGDIRICGHSKGGNLAVFAATHCGEEVEARICTVVSHDGPGQSEATIALPGYARIRDRLRVYLPHFSFVGMLLEHENSYTIVESDARTVLQHDAFSWQMRGRSMLHTSAPSEASLSTNQIIREWIATLDAEQRRLFIDSVYSIAADAYGDTIPDDLETKWLQNTQALIPAILKQDAKTRASFNKGLMDLFSTALKSIRLPWQKADEERAKQKKEASDQPGV